MIATGDIEGNVLLYNKRDRTSGKCDSHGMGVRALCFTHSGKSLISAGEDLHVFVSDVETKQRKQTMVGHTKWITDISTHP